MHVSIAGGIENAPINAKEKGCEIFQMFDRSPRGGKPNITPEKIKLFKENCHKYNFSEFYIHAPYYINLASANNRIRHGSISILRDELKMGTELSASGVMFHVGSAKDYGAQKSFELVVKGLKEILKNYKGNCPLLIENSAGAGQIIGADLKEVGKIIKQVKHKKLGFCYDTCHGFASGYDIRTKTTLNKTIAEIDSNIGLKILKVFHLNDSLKEFNSRRDRHANIGQGLIGKDAFEMFINHPKLKPINAILETPDTDKKKPGSLRLLKKLRKK